MKRLLTYSFMVAMVASLALPAVAREGGVRAAGRREAAEAAAKARVQANKTARLSEARKRVCENRARNVEEKAANFVRHAEKHLAVFDKISDRTQDFAEKRDRKPDNYDALLADVASKREQVLTDIAAFKQVAGEFDCEGENPEASGTLLKEQAKVVRESLKEYRTAIKNLIVGVKSSKRQNEQAGEGEE